jgi:hypothetical protein
MAISFPLGKYPEEESLGQVLILVPVSLEIFILFSITVVPTYISTKRVQVFSFLHTLTNICQLFDNREFSKLLS